MEPVLIARVCGGYLALTPPEAGGLRFAITAPSIPEARALFRESLAAWQRNIARPQPNCLPAAPAQQDFKGEE